MNKLESGTESRSLAHFLCYYWCNVALERDPLEKDIKGTDVRLRNRGDAG